MESTAILMEEHRVIERMLAVLRKAAAKVEAGEKVDPAVFRQAIDFIRNFADGYHHAKEENALFVAMESHGIPRQGGPIGVMLHDHDEGRARVRGMAEALPGYEAGDEAAAQSLVRHARGYAELLAAHIYKEDNILYPMGERVMPPEVHQRLLAEYSDLEAKVLSPEERDRYMKMVETLERELA